MIRRGRIAQRSLLLVALLAVGLASCTLTARMASPVPPRGEWPTHGGTNANARYSSLDVMLIALSLP